MADQETTLGKADEDDQTLGELAGETEPAPDEGGADAADESSESPGDVPQALLDRARAEGLQNPEKYTADQIREILSLPDRAVASVVRSELASEKPHADTGSDDEVKLPDLQGEDGLVTMESLNAYLKARDQRDAQREQRLLRQLEAARSSQTESRLDTAIAGLTAAEREAINRRPAAKSQLADEFRVMLEVDRRRGRRSTDQEVLRRAMPGVFGDELKAVSEQQVREKVTERAGQMLARPGSTSRRTKQKDKWTKAEEKLATVLPDDQQAYDDTLHRAL